MDLSLILKGAAMGIAEAIPGVSGGTIAFITGIYERLLNCIKSVNPSLLGEFKRDGIAGVWKKMDMGFLLMLGLGMVGGLVTGVFVISYLLETFPILLWSFFFGLILASCLYIGKQVDKWKIGEILLLLLGTVIAYFITIAAPAQGSESLAYVFFSGMLAISALMLPGLSGSFILLLLGMYTYIVPTVKTALKTLAPDALVILLVFGSGCLVGMLSFSHLLSWTFKNYRNLTLATLTGFMFGSLNKVWPWQEVLKTKINSKGEEVVSFTQSVLPGTFASLKENFFYGTEPMVPMAILLMIVGFGSVFLLEKLGNK